LESLATEYLVSEKFRRFFLAYSKAINKQEKRSGSLFKKYFRRKPVEKESYLLQLVYYIHTNPQHHGFKIKLDEYNWSSYKILLSNEATKLCKTELLGWFGGKKNFIEFHQRKQDLKEVGHILIEEF
jgi:hypothetical protein